MEMIVALTSLGALTNRPKHFALQLTQTFSCFK